MAFGKLTKAEQKDFNDLFDAYVKAFDALKAVADADKVVNDAAEFTEAIEAAKAAAESAEGAADDVASFVANLRDDQQGQYDDKSEKWQESDRASVVSDWIDTLNEVADTSLRFDLDTAQPEEYPAKPFAEFDLAISDGDTFLDAIQNVTMEAEG